MIRHFMAQVKTEDLLNVAFMKPIEVTLRTNRTDKTLPPDSLPEGLMQVIKENGITDNKYKLERFHPVSPDITSLDALKEKHMDNYISLIKKEVGPEVTEPGVMVDEVRISQAENAQRASRKESKSKHQGLEVGICVSMQK
jgi:hypothetical protein